MALAPPSATAQHPGLEPASVGFCPPNEQAVDIWRCGQLGMGEQPNNPCRLDGSELVEGLELDLEEIGVV